VKHLGQSGPEPGPYPFDDATLDPAGWGPLPPAPDELRVPDLDRYLADDRHPWSEPDPRDPAYDRGTLPGRDAAEPPDCPRCGGAGGLQEVDADGRPVYTEVPCRACGGYGYLS
jgi:hypothetical protein